MWSGSRLILLGVGPQPADRGLAVLDLRGEDGVLAEPVVDAGHGVALGGQRQGGATFLAARPPCPAVNPDDHRQPAFGLFGQIEVQSVPRVAVGDVREVPQRLDARRQRRRRRPLRPLLRGRRTCPCQHDRQSDDTDPCLFHVSPPSPGGPALWFPLVFPAHILRQMA